jgi:hypothetical protein
VLSVNVRRQLRQAYFCRPRRSWPLRLWRVADTRAGRHGPLTLQHPMTSQTPRIQPVRAGPPGRATCLQQGSRAGAAIQRTRVAPHLSPVESHAPRQPHRTGFRPGANGRFRYTCYSEAHFVHPRACRRARNTTIKIGLPALGQPRGYGEQVRTRRTTPHPNNRGNRACCVVRTHACAATGGRGQPNASQPSNQPAPTRPPLRPGRLPPTPPRVPHARSAQRLPQRRPTEY